MGVVCNQEDGWEKHLQKAVFLYPPESLARVWARWLLGAIQWGIPEKRGEAAKNWKIAIHDLTHLKERAEWQNQPQAVNNYAEKLTAMQGALDIQRNQPGIPITGRKLMERDFSPKPDLPVIVIGSAGVDIVGLVRGELQSRTSSPANIRTSFGGVARNVAENLARLGQPVNLISVVGAG